MVSGPLMKEGMSLRERMAVARGIMILEVGENWKK